MKCIKVSKRPKHQLHNSFYIEKKNIVGSGYYSLGLLRPDSSFRALPAAEVAARCEKKRRELLDEPRESPKSGGKSDTPKDRDKKAKGKYRTGEETIPDQGSECGQ